jgi:hypothetical protein
MKPAFLTAILLLSGAAYSQDVQHDYNRSANFNGYETYQLINYRPVAPGDQLLDQNIKLAVDEQLAGNGWGRVHAGGDLLLGYQADISYEKEYAALGWGPRCRDPGGDDRVTTSTIDKGKLVIGLFDPSMKELVWRSTVSKTLHIKKDPDRNTANSRRRSPTAQGGETRAEEVGTKRAFTGLCSLSHTNDLGANRSPQTM